MIKLYPLSSAQKRIWYAQKKYGNSPVFNIGGRVVIQGNADIEILRRSIQSLVARNDALRFQLQEIDGMVNQSLCDDPATVEYLDFSGQKDPVTFCHTWCVKQAQIPFCLTKSPLYYFAIFRLDAETTGYFVKMHHIIADGWAMKLLTEQIAQGYESILNHNVNENPMPSYLDFIVQEKGANWGKEKVFWEQRMAHLPEGSIPTSMNLTGGRKSFLLSAALRDGITEFMKKNKITWNVFFVGIYLMYLYKKYGQTESSTGLPFLCRTGKKQRLTFGTFTNPMPFCFSLDPTASVEGFYRTLAEQIKETYANQSYPSDLLAEKAGDTGREGPLFHACINAYNTSMQREMGGFKLVNWEFYRGCQEQALQIIIRSWDENTVELDFDYQTAFYSDGQILDMWDQWRRIIDQLIMNPQCGIHTLSLVSEQEKRERLSVYSRHYAGCRPQADSWIGMFFEQALKCPEREAISHGASVWSYEHFRRLIHRNAAHYISLGLHKGDIVLVRLPHTMESIAAICAVMLCGAAYLPVDPSLPSERVKEVLQGAQADFVMGEVDAKCERPFLPSSGIPVSDADPLRLPAIKGDDIAYIIYTSGSTGRPKGVKISHKSLANYLCWAEKAYCVGPQDVHALFSSFSFDFTMTALFLPIISGGVIRIYAPSKESPNVFFDMLRENRVSILKVTPSHIRLMLDIPRGNQSIHTMIIGGEELKTHSCQLLSDYFAGNIVIYNEYGPTEATIGCVYHRYVPEMDKGESIPIGKPIDGMEAYLLDSNMQLAPRDTTVELLLGGIGITNGYCGDAGQEEQRFICNPFMKGKKLYKTGDLAYLDAAGNLVYAGRLDDEVKIRGYRINPLEIERKAMESGLIDDIAVKVGESHGSAYLCAYVVSGERFDERMFVDWLAKSLPEYMMPRGIVPVKVLPLTVNGKVDLTALPSWEPSGDSGAKISACADNRLNILIEICREILSSVPNLDGSTNYYAVGGDSIQAIQIASRLQQRGYEISVADILTNPILSNMAGHMKERVKDATLPTPDAGPFEGPLIVRHFFEQQYADPGHYNQSVVLQLHRRLPKEWVEKALTAIVRHHDALRINQVKGQKKLFYNPAHLDRPVAIHTICSDKTGWSEIEKDILDQIALGFDLYRDLLFRAYLIESPDVDYLYLQLHHLVTDAVSWQILLRDMEVLIEQNSFSHKLILPDKSASYADFSRELVEWTGRNAEEVEDIHRDFMPAAYSVRGVVDRFGDFTIRETWIDASRIAAFSKVANDFYDARLHELLAISLALTVQQMLGEERIVLELESHGRDTPINLNVNRTIGWFTIMYPVELIRPHASLSAQIQKMKSQLRNADKYKLLYMQSRLFSEYASYGNRVRFNYMGEYVDADNDYWSLIRRGMRSDISTKNELPYSLDVNLMMDKGDLHIVAGFNPSWNRQYEALLSRWLDQIQYLIYQYPISESKAESDGDK